MAFHETTVGMYDLPCSCKVRHELRATEELRRLDYNYGKPAIFRRQNHGIVTSEDDEDEAENNLESLMFGLFALNDKNRKSTSPLRPWRTCSTLQEHEGLYLRRARSPKWAIKTEMRQLSPEFGRSSSATEPGTAKLFRKDLLGNRAKSDTLIRSQDGEGIRAKSPHSSLRFYHFERCSDYMRHYCDKVTANNIRTHIQSRLQQNAARKPVKVSKKNKVVHEMYPTKKTKSFRFRVNTVKDSSSNEYGILRVGACTARAKPMERLEINCTKEKTKALRQEREKNSAPLHTPKIRVGKNAKIATMYDLSKDKNSDINSILNPNLCGATKPNATTVQSKCCKNVRLKVWEASLHYQMAKHGLTCSNKAKPGNQPKVPPKKNSPDIPMLQRKVPYKHTLGEREFLHITTPKPLSTSSQSEPNVQINGESPSATPSLSQMRSPPFVEYTVIPRNMGNISHELFMKREPQPAIPKNSNFRACITPSNYSNSSIAYQLKERREPNHTEDVKNCAKEYLSDEDVDESSKIQRVASTLSVPQIGPFILG